MKSVNIIKFQRDLNATLNRHLKIVVDQKPLVDILEQKVLQPTPGHWRNKSKALVNITDLQRSVTQDGELQLLICANCAAEGYTGCGDLGLQPFKIYQRNEFIEWSVLPPNSSDENGDQIPIGFRFHRPQYTAMVQEVVGK